MQLKFSKSGMLVIAGIVVVALVLLVLPVSVPYTISVPGKILAQREWVVAQGADGRIVTRLVDRVRGVTNDYTVTQFERGDAFEFHLNDNIFAGALLRLGDTIGVARSSAIEQELTRLRGELATGKALLSLNATGDKQSVVNESRQQLTHAERNAEVKQTILQRQKSLFERNMISQQEYDLASREASLAAIEIDIAKARLQSVTTGAKKEQTEYDRAHINSLENEISVLERRLALGTLVAPLTGVAMNVASNDTLLIISDTSDYVVVMPVHVQERSFLSEQQTVTIRTREFGELANATISSIDNTIYSLNGEQVVFVTARLQTNVALLLHGLTTQCTIECPSVAPREFVARTVRAALQ